MIGSKMDSAPRRAGEGPPDTMPQTAKHEESRQQWRCRAGRSGAPTTPMAAHGEKASALLLPVCPISGLKAISPPQPP
jgi:hypothetical protein